MTAASVSELARDGREDTLDLLAEFDQHSNGNDGYKGKDQGVFHQRLPLFTIVSPDAL